MKVKTGDNVRVLSGRDKGKEGKVLQVFPELDRVVVEGVNIRKRHLRASGRAGQIVEFPAPLHASNLQVIGTGDVKGGRVGYKFIDKAGKNQKVRVLRKAGKESEIA